MQLTSRNHQPDNQPMGWGQAFAEWRKQSAKTFFIMPAVLVVLLFSVFPLIISLYLSFSRLKFVRGGFELTWVGLKNYQKLLTGSEQRHFLGKFATLSGVGWLLLGLITLFFVYRFIRYLQAGKITFGGVLGQLITVAFTLALVWLALVTLTGDGLPGTLIVTLIFVGVGVLVQYLLGLGLALLTTQNLRGKRFFRVVYLIPMMITPVGVAYMFRMLTDTGKGPFNLIWVAIGWQDFSWVNTAAGARAAIIIGDVWQWTPFLFIVLLAALEGQSQEQVEAAVVDGASRWQIFRYITWPQLLPVSFTVVLIRLIEAFKIIDLPQVMTRGGPGTATESLTLHSFLAWRALDLGSSAAVAYLLLIIATFLCLTFVSLSQTVAGD